MNRALIPCPLLPKTGEGGKLNLTPALSQMLVPRGRGSGFTLPELSSKNRKREKLHLRISAHAGSLRPEMGFAIPDLGFNPVCKRLEKAVVFQTEYQSEGQLDRGLTDRAFTARRLKTAVWKSLLSLPVRRKR